MILPDKGSGVGIFRGALKKIGIYDTLGYKGYSDHTHLVGLLRRENETQPYKLPKRQAKSRSPVYIIEAADRTASTASVISQVKNTGLRFHSYNPQENARLSRSDSH